jgi:ketol-acid reductoisomerase
VADGFVPGKTLFPIEEAAKKATVIQYLLSDAGQVAMWPKIKNASMKATPFTSHTVSASSTGIKPESFRLKY